MREEIVFYVDERGNPRKEITVYRTRRDGTEYISSVSNRAPEDAQIITEREYNDLIVAAREAAREARERLRQSEADARDIRDKLAEEAKEKAALAFEELTRVGISEAVAEIIADVIESSF